MYSVWYNYITSELCKLTVFLAIFFFIANIIYQIHWCSNNMHYICTRISYKFDKRLFPSKTNKSIKIFLMGEFPRGDFAKLFKRMFAFLDIYGIKRRQKRSVMSQQITTVRACFRFITFLVTNQSCVMLPATSADNSNERRSVFNKRRRSIVAGLLYYSRSREFMAGADSLTGAIFSASPKSPVLRFRGSECKKAKFASAPFKTGIVRKVWGFLTCHITRFIVFNCVIKNWNAYLHVYVLYIF